VAAASTGDPWNLAPLADTNRTSEQIEPNQLTEAKPTSEEIMLRTCLRMGVFASAVFAVACPATAQEIVHAVTGTVSGIDASHQTITLFQDGGSRSTFKVMLSSTTRISFDKRAADDTTAAKEFQKQGAYVILFYFGMNENRTAVALQGLGDGPFSSNSGEVRAFDRHNGTITVIGKDAKKHSFKLNDRTVAETYAGAVDASEFHAEKGTHVQVVSAMEKGTPTALFIRQM
jgi:hypothetical protein